MQLCHIQHGGKIKDKNVQYTIGDEISLQRIVYLIKSRHIERQLPIIDVLRMEQKSNV